MKTQIIRVETHDDYISIRDKMSWSKARRILLVLPRRRPPLLRRLDLILLQRQAQALGSQVGLVTQDQDLILEAKELGIATFSTIPAAQRMTWKPLTRRRRLLRYRKTQKTNPVALRRLLNETRSRPEKNWVRLLFFLLGLSSFISLMLFFLPSATISVKPYQEEQTIEMQIRASPQIEVVSPSGLLPVEVFRVKVQGTLWGDASGIQQVGDKKASGTVLLTNLTDEVISVPRGTVIRTLGEPYIRFETTQNVTLPGGNGQSREVAVRALVAGSQGNVPARALGAVEGDLGLSISVENPQAVFGGSDRQGRVVSEADAARAYDTLITSLAENALQELENLIPSEKKLLPETLVIHQIGEKVFQPGVGEMADRFVLNLQVEFEGWAYDQAHLDRILNDAMNANLPEGMTAVEKTYQIHERKMKNFIEGESIEFTIEASRLMEEKIEAAQLTAAIRGLPLENALTLIQQQFRLTGLPDITVRPAWWSRLPFLALRIAVEER